MLESSHRLLLVLACGLICPVAPGCRQAHGEVIASAFERNARNMRPSEPEEARVVERDPVTGERTADRSFLDTQEGTRLNHGVHRTWYADGMPETLRSYVSGLPTGVWWTWWRTGALRSAYVFDPDRPTRMTWWHANGLLASEGLARNGTRTGPWRYWHENGELKSEGEFVGGRQSGPWVLYGEDGEWRERGRFLKGRRVGQWEFAGREGR